MTRLASTVSLALLGLIQGCATPSPWKQYFAPAQSMASLPPMTSKAVQIRSVEPSLMAKADQDQRSTIDEWQVAPEDLNDSQRKELRAAWLHTVRYGGNPSALTPLGSSSFIAAAPVNIHDGALERFAKSIGANVVFVSFENQGTRTETRLLREQVPIGSAYAGASSFERGFASGASARWHPIRVQVDQDAYTAVFWRRTSDASP